MTLQERRHDRLAVRLSLIISRLVSGETLFIRKLATEFGVSERTLRRDFRERLMYLDLDYYQGQCSLRSDIHSTRQEIDILTFAHRTGLAGVFRALTGDWSAACWTVMIDPVWYGIRTDLIPRQESSPSTGWSELFRDVSASPF